MKTFDISDNIRIQDTITTGVNVRLLDHDPYNANLSVSVMH